MLKTIIITGLILFSSSLLAADANQTLDTFFKGLKTLSADFEQVVENSQLSSVEVSAGKLWISRPGKFRWNYTKPFIQEIVSDGNKIWIYDADLEQVTIKAAQENLSNTPAVLLSNEMELTDVFSIRSLGDTAGYTWVELKPRDSDAGFTAIRLAFKEKNLAEMMLSDNLGQTTQIRFSSVQRNAKIDDAKFFFTAPPGVDIFDTSNVE